MATLSTENRRLLERTIVDARALAERAARAALEALAVGRAKPDGHMSEEQKALRNHLRARARQLGDKRAANDTHEIEHLVRECAYEHWHRMLFARFLAENNLLIEPDAGVAISLDECKELAKEEKTDLWTLAGRYAQRMLPQIFRADDPVLQVRLAREHELKLEGAVDGLPTEVFIATDSLGWCYQFWQTDEKKRVNESENKIGADELPAVTQLFTEDYMVDFLLDNTLGAWWAGRQLAANSRLLAGAKTEEECRRKIALPGCEWKYLRFVKDEKAGWRPAAGTFDGWPKTARELKCIDPCCGSGHFLVAMFERLVALRMAEEGLNERQAAHAAVQDNIFGLEIDPRCTQIAAFNLALAAWRRVGHCPLPAMRLACSGLAPNAKKEDWLNLAGKNEKLQRGMERLYQLFEKAPVLGSLINPRAGGDLLIAEYDELQPILERALKSELNDDMRELAVTANGVVEAAEILAGQFTLVATNVPYLGRGKQDEFLQDYCERIHSDAKADLATCFLDRCLSFCSAVGGAALVTPQSWLFQKVYQELRECLLRSRSLSSVARLGEHAFESPQAAGAFAAMVCVLREKPGGDSHFAGLDATAQATPREKAEQLVSAVPQSCCQEAQLGNPDCRIVIEAIEQAALLSKYADCIQGIKPADRGRLVRAFWEHPGSPIGWEFFMGSTERPELYAGRYQTFDFATFQNIVSEIGGRLQGRKAWKRIGVSVGQMRSLPVTLYSGEPFDGNAHALVPHDPKHLTAIWCFCSSPMFTEGIRMLDQKLDVTNATVVKVAFDLAYWQTEAAKMYPNGLPKPFSSDPTQWLFDGHPNGSDTPLHVAVARLLGYEWPRQTGSDFPDCPSVKPDGLDKHADDDGIVCIPSVRGEPSATDRLLGLLTAAGVKPGRNLDDWLRNSFFEEHCKLFHDRPFVWHIWDGRKSDGFHALVNYHKLADGVKGRRLLEKLTHAYLGDWITRQRDEVKDGKEGADARLAAALALKERLEGIIEGEPPFDIFVRWKPLAKQPIGWEPDINDGVRMNIRPFMASDLPGGKKGAGVLRVAPKIKWTKDPGKEPHRAKDEYPWFWSWDEKTKDFMGGKAFDGNRWNDCHYSNDAKREARR